MANNALAVQDMRLLAQMSPEFMCLIATALQGQLHTYDATGMAVEVL
jgi:hypothetical protein